MAVWLDQTVRVEAEPTVEVAPDGDVHTTWVEGGQSFTLIESPDEARKRSQKILDALRLVAEAVTVVVLAAASLHVGTAG